MNLKFYTSVAKGLKLKVWKFWALVPTFLEVTGEKLVGGLFAFPPSWIGLKEKILLEHYTKINCKNQITKSLELKN